MNGLRDFLNIFAFTEAMINNDINRVEYVAGKTEKFILKVPTKLTNIFRRKYKKHIMEIVSEPKKNNIFYYYIKVELKETNANYFDMMGIDSEGNIVDNYYFYFVYSGKDTVMCFCVSKDIPRTEDGYIKGIVSSPVMEQFIKIRDDLSKKEENK